MSDSSFWGYHLSIDASGADLASISNPVKIAAFSKDLVERIQMEAFGPPHIVRFGEGNKEGITLVQLISTSNIMCHFVESDGTNQGTGSYYFDCFSCKTFDINTVIDICREYFGNKSERVYYFVRQA